MDKKEYLDKLKNELGNLVKEDADNIINYYDELISDAVEEGENEKEFVSTLDNSEDIIKKFNIERKIKNAEEKPTVKNNMIALFAVFGAITSPIWVPLAIVFASVIFVLLLSGFMVVLSLAISTLTLFISFIASLALIVYTPYAFFVSLAILGVLLFLAGFTIITFNFIFNTVTLGLVNLIKNKLFKKGGKKNV